MSITTKICSAARIIYADEAEDDVIDAFMNNTVQFGSRYEGVPVRNCTAVDTWLSSSPTHIIKRPFTHLFGEPGDEARSSI